MVYSGFWRRVGAGLIDSIILQAIAWVILAFFGISLIDTVGESMMPARNMEEMRIFYTKWSLGWFILLLPYYSFFQSSKHQATPGMMVLSIRIVGYDGKKISFWRAFGRFLASNLSWIFFGIGYLMIAFTPRKQGLHDYIAKTLVIKS